VTTVESLADLGEPFEGDHMSHVAVIAKIAALPGKRADLIGVMQAGLATAESEPGTLQYVLHEDANDPDLIWFYEVYESQEALVAHGSSDGMKALGMASREFAAGRPELTFLTPVGGKNLV
jgi:quinol monooxygenase YgiN